MPVLHALTSCATTPAVETDTSSTLIAVAAYQSCDDLVVSSELILDRGLVNYIFPKKEKKTPEASLFLEIEKVLFKSLLSW